MSKDFISSKVARFLTLNKLFQQICFSLILSSIRTIQYTTACLCISYSPLTKSAFEETLTPSGHFVTQQYWLQQCIYCSELWWQNKLISGININVFLLCGSVSNRSGVIPSLSSLFSHPNFLTKAKNNRSCYLHSDTDYFSQVDIYIHSNLTYGLDVNIPTNTTAPLCYIFLGLYKQFINKITKPDDWLFSFSDIESSVYI